MTPPLPTTPEGLDREMNEIIARSIRNQATSADRERYRALIDRRSYLLTPACVHRVQTARTTLRRVLSRLGSIKSSLK